MEKRHCYALGDLNTQKFALIEKMYPLHGVSITYSDGSHCSGQDRNRTVEYQFKCDPQGASVPIHVSEEDVCWYVVHWPSPHGCPSVNYKK